MTLEKLDILVLKRGTQKTEFIKHDRPWPTVGNWPSRGRTVNRCDKGILLKRVKDDLGRQVDLIVCIPRRIELKFYILPMRSWDMLGVGRFVVYCLAPLHGL